MAKILEGKIIKGIGGFYYVDTVDGVIECRARGKLRHEGITPLVGDIVIIQDAYLMDIYPRKNSLIRPKVSNVDRAFIVFAVSEPKINYEILDRFLILASHADIEPVICINKIDLDKKGVAEHVKEVYADSGSKIIPISVKNNLGLGCALKELLGVTTVFAGPSGVGKSSIINLICPHSDLKTGTISKKISRGKHTTREAVLIAIQGGGYVVDTPGFTSLSLSHINPEELAGCFCEFEPYAANCKYTSCSHVYESSDDCAVKAEAGRKIHIKRYKRYERIYEELVKLEEEQYD